MKITEAEAQTPVELLERATPAEIEKLKAAEILTLGQLWSRIAVGDLHLAGFDQVADVTNIGSERLIEFLPARLSGLLRTELLRLATELDLNVPLAPDELPGPSVWTRPLHAARKFGHWLKRHLLDWIFLFALVSIGFLILRATGILASWPPPFGLNQRVVVTKRDLKAGDVLRLERDLSSARLSVNENYFNSAPELEGLILREDVSAQKPLRADNLLRLQVVAAKDIPSGEKVTKDAVTLAWSPCKTKALIRTEDAVDHQTRFAIRKDSIISAENLMP